LPQLIESELSQLTESAAARGVRFYYQKPDNFPPLSLDEMKIRQVVMNYLDNALYYTPKGGRVYVELKCDNDKIDFVVTDTGLGVPKAEQHKLFTKFFRAQNAKQMRPDGTGLGLYMTRKIIIAQGGDPRVLEDYSLLGTSSVKIPVLAETAGYVRAIDARAIGYALVRIKAGRMKVSDTLDYGAGALLIPKIGDFLEAGEPIGEIHANDPAQAELVARLVRAAYTLSSEPVPREDLILDSI